MNRHDRRSLTHQCKGEQEQEKAVSSQRSVGGRRRAAAGVAALAVLAVSGCGSTNLHSGSAAVVDGTAISQSQVDTMVMAACGFIKANNEANHQPGLNQSVAGLRNNLANSYIVFLLDDRAARKLHISISEAAISRFPSPIPKGVSAADRATLKQFFHQATKSQLQEAVIGEHLKDPSVTTADKITRANITSYGHAAMNYLSRFRVNQDVTVNPSLGIWSGTALQPGSGSLSDAVSTKAKKWLTLRSGGGSPSDLPTSQRCG